MADAGISTWAQGAAQQTAPVRQPNFVFVMTDDQSAKALGFLQHYPFLRTPNMDRLAREGAYFANAFVTTSLCSPSRASIMTGCHAHKHGVVDNSETRDPDSGLPLFPQLLQKNGYKTAFVGKWHMKGTDEPRAGFDYWLSFRGQGTYRDPNLNENGKSFQAQGYMTDILTDYAVNYLQREHEQPYCLFLWHKAVHAPFKPAPRHVDDYAGATFDEPGNFRDDFSGKPAWLRRGYTYGVHAGRWQQSEGKPVPDRIELEQWDRPGRMDQYREYFRTLNAVDDSLGKILETLDETGQADNTVVIFCSDNGFFMGEHRFGDKRLMWEESIRIPLLVRYPKIIDPGSRPGQMVLNLDLAPTILDWAQIDVPKHMDGRSMRPLFARKQPDWRDAFLYEYFQESYAPGFVTAVGVRTDHAKYIHYPCVENDIDELYDLRQDPGEMENLFTEPGSENLLKRMKQHLMRLQKETDWHLVGEDK